MTGAVQANSGVMSAVSFSYQLTPGNNGGSAGVFGYSTVDGSNPGSLSPILTFRGATIQRIRSSNVSEDLLINLATAGLPQTFWRLLVIQDTTGAWRRYFSSAATAFSNGVITSWSFGTGSSPVFTATTPAPRGVIFFT
jgi:hypothetical protein